MARIGRSYPAKPLIGRLPPLPPPPPPPAAVPVVFQASSPRLAWETLPPRT